VKSRHDWQLHYYYPSAYMPTLPVTPSGTGQAFARRVCLDNASSGFITPVLPVPAQIARTFSLAGVTMAVQKRNRQPRIC
jgi:hypothetical protein